MWSSLPDELLQLGLTRQILLDRSLSFVQSDVIITNNVMSALEAFRVKESLPQSFVYNWLCRLCPGVSE